MEKPLTKKYYINGPNNVVRLCKDNKILYIFGDEHLDPEEQNECPIMDEYESMDIDKFISLFIKTEKVTEFDLFAEFFDSMYKNVKTNKRENYIKNFIRLFQSKLKKSDNEVRINPLYKNIRFHFMDIRNTIKKAAKLLYFDENLSNKDNLNKKVIIKLYENLLDLKEYLVSSQNKYVNKILNRYSNKAIQETMNTLYQELILDNLDRIIKKVKQTLEKKITNLFVTDLEFLIVNLFVVITDLYFIRRFLDKNYINKSILYCGIHHLSDIIFILVKYFGFELSHSYMQSNIQKISKFNKFKTIDFHYIKELTETFYISNNNKPNQCVNLFNFPTNFS